MRPSVQIPNGLRNRNLWTIGLIGLFLLILLVGSSAILPTAGFDSRAVKNLAARAAYNKIEGGYAVVAWLYAHTNEALRLIITIVVSSIFIFYCTKPLRTNLILSISGFLIFSPIVFFLTQFTKDLFLVPFVLAAGLTINNSSWPRIYRIALVFAIYIIYALTFRSYYMLIAALFAGGVMLRRAPLPLLAYIAVAGLVALAYAPADLFMKLQWSRDAFNIDRVGRNIPGARTAFMNLERPDNYGAFLLNYAYAAVRLNLPLLFSFRIQELFLFSNVALYIFLMCIGLRIQSIKSYASLVQQDEYWGIQASAVLFGAHLAVLVCFEPDLGSYLRHLCSALPYLVPTLAVLDRRHAYRLQGSRREVSPRNLRAVRSAA